MTKLALLKKVSFNVTDSNIGLYLSDKVTFHDFDGTINMFRKINELIGNGMIEIINCDYNETYLMQAFFLENIENEIYENILITKRKINPNDTYIYTTESELLVKDDFEHVDVTFEDIERIMLRKYNLEGVQIEDDGVMSNIYYNVTYDKNTYTGLLNITIGEHNNSVTNSVKFLNYPALVKLHEKDNLTPEQFEKMVSDLINESQCQYYYTQKEFGLGLFNCYCPLFGASKNEIMSKMMGENICGNSYIGLENHLNNDNIMIPLNVNMVNKILKFLSVTDFKQKNGSFCNIFYELSDY